MKRGDLVTIAVSGDYGKPRPALVVQANAFDTLASVTVLRLTSELHDWPTFRVTIAPTPENKLRVSSQVMIDKAVTVPREKIGKPLGGSTRRPCWQSAERSLHSSAWRERPCHDRGLRWITVTRPHLPLRRYRADPTRPATRPRGHAGRPEFEAQGPLMVKTQASHSARFVSQACPETSAPASCASERNRNEATSPMAPIAAKAIRKSIGARTSPPRKYCDRLSIAAASATPNTIAICC